MSKKCNTCGMEYDDALDKCPVCSNAADNVTKITPDADRSSQNDVKEAAAEAAESIKKAVKAAANTVADKASAAASDVMNSEAVKNVKAGKVNNKTIGVVAVAAAAVIIIGIVIGVISGNNYKAPIDHLVDGIESGSCKDFFKAMPNFVVSELKEYGGYDYYEELFEDLNDDLKDEYGKNYTITYTVKDKEKIKKSGLRDVRDNIKDEYDKKVKVTEGYTLKLKLKIKGRDSSDKTETTINVYKINGKWCILGYYGSGF